MGLLHTSGRELGRYRELQAYWPEINNLDTIRLDNKNFVSKEENNSVIIIESSGNAIKFNGEVIFEKLILACISLIGIIHNAKLIFCHVARFVKTVSIFSHQITLFTN